jgi:ferredoxin
MRFQLRIDLERCTGHGMCALLAPSLIDLDQWGFPVLRHESLPSEAEARSARRAVAACPVAALKLEPAAPQRPR